LDNGSAGAIEAGAELLAAAFIDWAMPSNNKHPNTIASSCRMQSPVSLVD
jgi:hypothetical protein